jgi:hypothetical protein
MKTILSVALLLGTLCSCKTKPQAPLVGDWKLMSVSTTPAAAGPEGQSVGTIYTFRPDSTLSIGAAQARQHYELQRLPEGMFLVVGDSPAVKYRVASMTPAELSLQQDLGESTRHLRLEAQSQ